MFSYHVYKTDRRILTFLWEYVKSMGPKCALDMYSDLCHFGEMSSALIDSQWGVKNTPLIFFMGSQLENL